MAHYKLSDILQRELWTTEDINDSPELLALYTSGILGTDKRVTKLVNSSDGGSKIEIPFIQVNEYEEPNISDDSNTLAVPDKFEKKQQMAFVGNYNKAWGAYDIARELDSGKDPYVVVRDFIGKYWALDIKHKMASFSIGAYESNKANEGGDLINDKSGTNFSYDLVLDTLQLKGDIGVQGTSFMIMNSQALTAIKKSDSGRTRAVIDDKGKILYSLYDEQAIIIVDDIMPYDGTNTTVLFADIGAFTFADSNKVINPLMYERNELIGDGGGKEIVISRKRYLLALNGYSFTGNVQAKNTGVTLAELQDANNHTRIVDKKQSPISWLTFKV